MKKIKVLHISETFASGVYTYIKNVCKFLENDKRFELYVLYSNVRTENEKEEIINKEFPNSTKFIPINLSREISIKEDFRGLLGIRNIIKKINPDIVHLHSSKAGILGRIACFGLKGIKVFYTPHGYSFIREDISLPKKKIFYGIEKYITKIFNGTIIACGDSEYELGKKFTNEILLVRNGIKLKKSDTINDLEGKREGEIVVGTSGRIHIQKNPYLFNEVAKLLPNVSFIWIGDGELKTVLNSSNIIVTGWKTNEEVLDLLKKIDVFISTSLWEGLPFNILEAMLLAKPIVSNNILGNRVTIKNGVNGFLCDSKEEFVNAIKYSFENKIKFGKASKDLVKELFDLENNLQKLKAVYLQNAI